jgi:hypothetical protein
MSLSTFVRRFPLALLIISLPWFGLSLPAAAQSQVQQKLGYINQAAPTRYLPEPPTELELCGERVPLDQRDVAERLDREFNIAVHDPAQVVMWLKRAQRYFPYFEKRLKEAGLPEDLKYLAVAESSLLSLARSYAGAVGTWQFIADTGRRYGLRRNRYFDDRLNVEKATDAALRYLKDLKDEFGSWSLAMAAYNCGERRVRDEIKEQGQKDYYQLYLPLETRRYLFRIMAAKIILQNPEQYGYLLKPSRLYDPIPRDVVTIKLRRMTHLRTLAAAAGSTFYNMKQLNPEVRGDYLPSGTHRLNVPQGQGASLAKRLAKMRPDPAPPHAVWVVKSGDTLSLIAHQTGVTISALRRANRLNSSQIFPGQRLVIPAKR